MRNESLTAYVLHVRPYQEKRAIYQLLTQQHGVVHGIGKKGMPQFVPLTLFATGKNTLKTLTQMQLLDASSGVPHLQHQARYASFYINEITLKLLPIEDEVAQLFDQYQFTVTHLKGLTTSFDSHTAALKQQVSQTLKLLLRHYEHHVLLELGLAIDWSRDAQDQPIEPDTLYRYVIETGWLATTEPQQQGVTDSSLKGSDILAVSQFDWHTALNGKSSTSPDQTFLAALWAMSTTHRQVIDHLFDYRPLQSRILWQQWQAYQS